MNTQRRNFIKISSSLTGALLIPGIFTGCVEETTKNVTPWNGHNYEEKDIRFIVLSYAILAPNPHNKQPWLIQLKDEQSFDLYVDTNRTLPQTDPFFRQIHIGQGTFLENLNLAAQNFGYKAVIKYFPQGQYSNSTIEHKPIASIQLVQEKDISKDDLFDQILLRQSNKREYNNKTAPFKKLAILKNKIKEELESGFSLNITSKKDHLKKLREVAVNSMKIESADHDRDMETIKMFRFSTEEVNLYKDGFGLAQTGVTGVKKFVLENIFLSRKSAQKDPISFGKEAISMTKNQVDSTTTFAWLSTKNNTRLDQVKIGRVYERINLLATSLGLVIHPISQVLQEYQDMDGLQKEFLEYLNVPKNHTVQMFFRIGIAQKVEHSPRRNINDLLIG